MRIAHLSIMAMSAAAVFVVGTSAITAQPRRQGARPPLLPLTDGDQNAARGSGCQLSFTAARGTLVYVIGHEFMIRTGPGRTVCPISDERFSALSGGGVMNCGGYRITIRQTGRTVANQASDSAVAPATLTVAGRGRPWQARGQWGTAC